MAENAILLQASVKDVADIEPVSAEIVELMAETAREADRAEFQAIQGWSVLDELRRAVELSYYCRAFYLQGELAGIFGCIRHDEDTGWPWLISGAAVDKGRKAFLIACREQVAIMRRNHPVLLNFTDARYSRALAWMRWMGFEMHAAVPYGVNGEPFHPFTMRSQ